MGASHPGLKTLMVGLDGSGKTTLLYKLKLGEVVATQPTTWLNIEQLQYRKINFTIWDMSGQEQRRQLWRHYYKQTQALIFVIDASDRKRIEDATSLLGQLLQDEELIDAIILIVANKTDIPGSMQIAELSRNLLLYTLDREWHIQNASGVTGEGLFEGLDWIAGEFWKKGPPPQSLSWTPFGRREEIDNGTLAVKREIRLLQLWQRLTPVLLFVWANKESALHNSAFSLSRAICQFLPSSEMSKATLLTQDEVESIVQLFTRTAFFVGVTGVKPTKDEVPALIKQHGNKQQQSTDLLFLHPKLEAAPAAATAVGASDTLTAAATAAAAVAPAEPTDLQELPSTVITKSGVSYLDDEELLRRFEAADETLRAYWNHVVFLRVIYNYLARQGRQACVKKVLDGMQVLEGNCFNMTVCYFWIQIVDYSYLLDIQVGISAPYPSASSASSASSSATTTATTTTSVRVIVKASAGAPVQIPAYGNDESRKSPNASDAGNCCESWEKNCESVSESVSESKGDNTTEFHMFLLRHPYLLQDSLICQYYSDKVTYNNLSTRFEVFLPDLKALPSIVSFSQRESSPLNAVHPARRTTTTHREIIGISDKDLVEAVRSLSSAHVSDKVAKLRKEWSHTHMLHFIFEVLRAEGREAGTSARIVDDLSKLLGDAHHVTITYFWIQIIDFYRHKRVRFAASTNNQQRVPDFSGLGSSCLDKFFVSSVDKVTFEMVFEPFPELQRESLFLDYFSHKLIFNNPKAHTEVVLPDLKPLPSLQPPRKR